MKLSRRALLVKTVKAAGAVALAGVAGMSLPRTARAHTDIDEEITIVMGDLFFQEDGKGQGEAIQVPANRVVRLVFRNEGAVLHDAHFGRDADLDGRQYRENLSAPFDMLEIPPGSEAWLTFTFTDDQKGDWEIGCFQPGHYEAGMKSPFVVV